MHESKKGIKADKNVHRVPRPLVAPCTTDKRFYCERKIIIQTKQHKLKMQYNLPLSLTIRLFIRMGQAGNLLMLDVVYVFTIDGSSKGFHTKHNETQRPGRFEYVTT